MEQPVLNPPQEVLWTRAVSITAMSGASHWAGKTHGTSHVAVQPLRETTPAAARAVRRWDLRFHAGVMSRIPATRLTADTR